MLVLSRKNGEQIIVGENIVVTVLDARRGSVRVGISAPGQVPVLRGELVRHAQPTARRAVAAAS